MDKKLLTISLVGYCLMIISYTLGLIEKYNVIIGLFIITIVIIVILVSQHIFYTQESDSMEESISESQIGVNIKGKDISFEDIEQTNDSKKKIIGKDMEGENITFKKIRQF